MVFCFFGTASSRTLQSGCSLFVGAVCIVSLAVAHGHNPVEGLMEQPCCTGTHLGVYGVTGSKACRCNRPARPSSAIAWSRSLATLFRMPSWHGACRVCRLLCMCSCACFALVSGASHPGQLLWAQACVSLYSKNLQQPAPPAPSPVLSCLWFVLSRS